MNISDAVLDVLSNAEVNGNALKLIGQLDRALYVSTNKVLEAAGGKWNRKAQAHLFDGDASEIMDQIILTGKITDAKQELGDFPSPAAVVNRLIELAKINNGDSMFEPNAGSGNILKALHIAFPLNRLYAVEINTKYTHLKEIAEHVYYGDFLTVIPTPDTWSFDRIVMNPPFAKQVDIKHVLHALNFLAPGGRLASVMSSGITFRSNKLTEDFRAILKAHNGTIEPLPEGSFLSSGTNVNTVIITMEK